MFENYIFPLTPLVWYKSWFIIWISIW